MVTIEEASKLFSTLGLEKHQIENLIKQYSEYFEQNKSANKEKIHFEVCPKCGKVHQTVANCDAQSVLQALVTKKIEMKSRMR